MTTFDVLTRRNEEFVDQRFSASQSLMPTLKTMIVGCVDPRVDPAHVLGIDAGEAVVIRNIGGRITPATLQTMALLGMIGRADGVRPGGEWSLVILHHTDCGITRLTGAADLLAAHLGVAPDQFDPAAVSDPRRAVAADVAFLREHAALPGEIVVAGLVYDVATGRVDFVVPPAPLREAARVA